ncbi:MAG: nuclear transport factor 2 family protein [Burkholderiales bacterium]|nr:nuclear transport factor 2 family protein [Burkholderiales bacterium]
MTQGLPQAVLEATDITAVTQLILLERESRDLGRWDTMRECFHPDSLVRISWYRGDGPGFVAGSIDMARRNVLAKHRLGPILVRLAGNRAVATLSAIIDIPVTLKAVPAHLSSHARFVYRAERRPPDPWRIAGFDSIYLRDELTTPIPGQPIPVT